MAHLPAVVIIIKKSNEKRASFSHLFKLNCLLSGTFLIALALSVCLFSSHHLLPSMQPLRLFKLFCCWRPKFSASGVGLPYRQEPTFFVLPWPSQLWLLPQPFTPLVSVSRSDAYWPLWPLCDYWIWLRGLRHPLVFTCRYGFRHPRRHPRSNRPHL